MNKGKKVLLTAICPDSEITIQLALYYLKAYFESHHRSERNAVGIVIKIFTQKDEAPQIAEAIIAEKPDMVGFSCYVWNITRTLQISRIIKEGNPEITLVLGGPEVSSRHEELASCERSIDFIVRGEGEETFSDLVLYSLGGAELSEIRGITFMDQDRGLIVSNPSRPLIKDIDEIPSPYLEGLIDFDETMEVPLETLRGCPYRCHYCYYHKEFDKIRFFALSRVEEELGYILPRKPSMVYLMDPTFNLKAERAKEILRIFCRYNQGSKLHVELKAELLDEEMIDLILQANTTFIEIGLQSTNPKALKLINRTLDRKKFKRNIRLLNEKKVNYEIQLIDSLPGDTYEDLKESLDWLYLLDPPRIKIMRLMLLPGTYMREHAEEFSLVYDSQPPYYSTGSKWMSADDLEKANRLRAAMVVMYHASYRRSINLLRQRLDISFSTILETWISLNPELSELLSEKDVKLKLLNGPISDLIKYLCEKNEKPDVEKEIANLLEKDLENFYLNEMIKDFFVSRFSQK